MFDEIYVKQNLPIPKELENLNIDWKNYKFQTKDLENCMEEYFIDENGELFLVEIEREYIEYTEEEKKKKINKFFPFWKDVIEKSRTNKKVDFHGKIRFYTYEELNDELDFSIDFDAYFVYGKLDKIEMVEYKTYPSRKIGLEDWKNEMKRKQNCPIFKIKKFLSKYTGWNWIWRKVSDSLYYISRFFSKCQHFILRTFL